MKHKAVKWLILIAVVLLAAAGIFAGIWFFAGSASEPVNVFAFEYIGMTEYWGDTRESYGLVQTDRVQTVYLSESQTVIEILVQQGDTVKKGDVLLTFDTTLSDLSLERKRLDVEKLKLQLEDAIQQLAQINSMRPMVVPTFPDTEETPDLGVPLSGPWQISENMDYDGSSEEKALICWLGEESEVKDALLEALRLKAEQYQNENAAKEPEEPENGEASAESSGDPSLPSQPEEPETITVDEFYVVFRVTEADMSKGSVIAWQGIVVIRDKETGEFRFRFFDASDVPDHMQPDEDQDQTPEIDFGSGFTAAQIAEMRIQQEKQIREIQFSIKMAETEYKIMQTEISDGNIYAQVDGTVVSVLSEEEAYMSQQPIVKVSGGGGFHVEGTISELERDTVLPGMEVTVNDWNTGMVYTGTVESIGDFPSTGNGWNGMGNPNTSYYPFTIFVSESADLQSGSYVSITYSAGSTENGIYLENPFLRTEGGRSYVFVMGADGTLEKRYVTTGKSLWGSYTEILDGITIEDYIAFPYGNHVQPGAEAVIAEISALYE